MGFHVLFCALFVASHSCLCVLPLTIAFTFDQGFAVLRGSRHTQIKYCSSFFGAIVGQWKRVHGLEQPDVAQS